MANYFRSDGWVKSALGPAVPGAQVYLCLQPANIATLPPSPLVNIFSDPRGLVPITQPIITDGFGHYDFYAQAGVYTLIVGLGGIIQQVYPDQSSGGASTGGSGGTAIILQTNGTNNANQLLLNLIGAVSIAVTDEGNGTIAIAGAVFQTNGAPNTVQNKLNLVAGTGMALSSDSLGDVTISSTVSGAAAARYMIGAGMLTPPAGTPSGFCPSVDSAFDIMAVGFTFTASLTFNTVSFAWSTGSGGPPNVAFALYSTAGALLYQSGAIVLGSFTTGQKEATIPSFTLNPGQYYLCTACDSLATQIFGFPLLPVTSGADNSFNFSKPIIGVAANVTTSGLVFPSTLGAVNGVSAHGNGWSFPYIMFYNLP